MRHQCNAGRQTTAGAGTPDGDTAGQHAERFRFCMEPAHSGVAILNRHRKGMPRRQTVIHRGHRNAGLADEGDVIVLVYLGIAHDEAAPMDPEHRRNRVG
jgi:hypothetical protein